MQLSLKYAWVNNHLRVEAKVVALKKVTAIHDFVIPWCTLR